LILWQAHGRSPGLPVFRNALRQLFLKLLAGTCAMRGGGRNVTRVTLGGDRGRRASVAKPRRMLGGDMKVSTACAVAAPAFPGAASSHAADAIRKALDDAIAKAPDHFDRYKADLSYTAAK
ncbi:MAG: hypothetical protein ACREPZ_01280, partial [Rhodanobacteraceae bacterium]